MGQTLLHGLESNFHYTLRGREIWITHLQANNLSSAGFESQDAIRYRDGWRLSQGIELSVEALHKIPSINGKQFISTMQISSTFRNSCKRSSPVDTIRL
jgi:hypothetical protein